MRHLLVMAGMIPSPTSYEEDVWPGDIVCFGPYFFRYNSLGEWERYEPHAQKASTQSEQVSPLEEVSGVGD